MIDPRHSLAFVLAAGALAIGGCSREAEAPLVEQEANAAVANGLVEPAGVVLAGGDGATLGSVTMTQDANGVTIRVDGSGLPVGAHGVHLHEKGLCEGQKFTSAGAHWNPAAKQHGRDNPAGAHLGDLANIDVPASGAATGNFLVAGASLGGAGEGGAGAIADVDGTAIVVHAKADDYKTDPSGDSGDRIACAVLAPPK